MLRTEEQARKTQCCGPQSCGEWIDPDPDNPDPFVNTPWIRICIGPACMAWREEIVATTATDHDGNAIEQCVGYCGLAGLPPSC